MQTPLLPDLGHRTLIMGILNLTADSFSGDGILQTANPMEAALQQARQFVQDGADILDLGAESTRPGAVSVDAETEMQRLLPLIHRLRQEFPVLPLSVDTYKAAVAEACLLAGADMINDIWGLKADPNMAQVVSKHHASIVLMHNRATVGGTELSTELGGRYVDVNYEDILQEVKQALRESVDLALQSGIPAENIIIDPGIGFGKTTRQNLELLKHFEELSDLGYPILLGVSRKSFIGYTLNIPPEERLAGSLAANAYGVLHGAAILRVHDVRETVQLARMLEAIRSA